MKRGLIVILLATLLSAATGCYWRPGYYLNGGQYASYPYAQPAYPQPYAQPIVTQPVVQQPVVQQPVVAAPAVTQPVECCQPCYCQ